MILCPLDRLLFVLFSALAIAFSVNRSSAEELLSVHLHRVMAGEFPAQDWFPEDRRSIEAEIDSMSELVKELAKLDQPAMKSLKRAFADRCVIVHNLDAANLKNRIDEVCEIHQPIIKKLQNIRWSNEADRIISFEIINHRYEIQSLAYLVNLFAAREVSEGRFESASKALASGFAFAHNLTRTYGDLNLVLGIVLQSVMTQGIADLQSMGAPDMQLVFSRLGMSQMDQDAIDRSLWKSACFSMPVLVDRPRKPSEWHDDVEATLKPFGRADLTPESEEETERIGRQLQTLVQAGKRVKTFRVPIKYQFGGLAEAKNLQPGQVIRFTPTINVPALAQHVETLLDKSILNQSRDGLLQRLCGLHCVERLRLESSKRGQWLLSIDGAFRDGIVPLQGTRLRPAIIVLQGVNDLPSYEIRLPEKNFVAEFFKSSQDSNIVAVGIARELSNE